MEVSGSYACLRPPAEVIPAAPEAPTFNPCEGQSACPAAQPDEADGAASEKGESDVDMESITLEDMLEEVMDDAAYAGRQRLTKKTSPQAAYDAGHLDAHCVIPPPVRDTSIFAHGGMTVQTDDNIWCTRCGASATYGSSSIYLRKLCKGKPPNDSMRQRRRRLLRHKHPTTSKDLQGRPKRIRIE